MCFHCGLLHVCFIVYARFEAIESIEDAMTQLKVLDFSNNCIRLSLTTHIPNLERLSCQHKIRDITEPSEPSHELLIEVMAGTMELKNVEVRFLLYHKKYKEYDMIPLPIIFI